MIAALFNIPGDFATFKRFSFHNNDAHVLASRFLRSQFGLSVDEYPLDPIPENDIEGWLYTHQAAHNAINGALGLSGNDLTAVDVTKKEQLINWIEIHANEHVSWGNILGYG